MDDDTDISYIYTYTGEISSISLIYRFATPFVPDRDLVITCSVQPQWLREIIIIALGAEETEFDRDPCAHIMENPRCDVYLRLIDLVAVVGIFCTDVSIQPPNG